MTARHRTAPPKRIAWITLRHRPPYRSDAFAAGFEDLGFQVKMIHPERGDVKPEDVVVVWNLNPRYRGAAGVASKVGASLLVTENGYLPSLKNPQPCYALARNGHNGSGTWYVGKEDRWGELGYTLANWADRPEGYILVADQRGIGSELMQCPRPFFENIEPKLKRLFARANKRDIPPIRLRSHPGRHRPARSLDSDLAGARAVVTWASNVANLSLLEGIPTFRMAPYHVNSAALSDLSLITAPPETDRETGFRNLAWAQWSLSEIEDGVAFRHLLRDVL